MKNHRPTPNDLLNIEEQGLDHTLIDPMLLVLIAFDEDEVSRLTPGELHLLVAVAEAKDLDNLRVEGIDEVQPMNTSADYKALVRARLVQNHCLRPANGKLDFADRIRAAWRCSRHVARSDDSELSERNHSQKESKLFTKRP